MVRRRRIFADFLRHAFLASRVQHVSDLHPKFALRPHQIGRGKKEGIGEETTGQKYNGLFHRAAIINSLYVEVSVG